MSVRVFAPAKINLTLQIGAPRADGMHPLQSVVMFADIGDVVEAEASSRLSFAINGDFAEHLEADPENLVLRAVRALAEAVGVPAHAKLTLEKNLPIASGIGGGSADAAATLRALNDVWRLEWSNEQLARVGRQLGADVPVFFTGASAAYMTGVGETCAPIDAPEMPAVLVNPMIPLATPAVYRQFDAMGLGQALEAQGPPEWEDLDHALDDIAVIGNDLEPAARALVPEIGDVLAVLRGEESVRYAALSGSGATCFALLEDWEQAESLAEKLAADWPAWWVCETILGGA
ncbi:MAG: 4-(cytidine 5'-diphospho)-2-C-methyl-D-erythritol kinase [Caulobacterales bacterium]|jgi:4-diphosphocytidyl-2-C-methyl-D-erythritol kinase|nr:4-(cytidine 5'-diphospho)-2-C-methyl-D-erythritol kinase [Caulobacterales bacterium]